MLQPRMSTLTEAEEEQIRRYVDNKWDLHTSEGGALLREIEFLRGMINDLTQDGVMEVYNKGYARGVIVGKRDCIAELLGQRVDITPDDDVSFEDAFGSECVDFLNTYYIELKEQLKDSL